MKYLQATLKKPIVVRVQFEPDFNKNMLEAVALTEMTKRNLVAEIKQNLHERIVTLSLDDIEFEFKTT